MSRLVGGVRAKSAAELLVAALPGAPIVTRDSDFTAFAAVEVVRV